MSRGPLEMLLVYYRKVEREQHRLVEQVDALTEQVAKLETRLAKTEAQLAEQRRLRRGWTIRCQKAKANRDMWRTRALDAHGTKRRMRGSLTPTGDETSNAGPF